jgi:hypothetical protein
VVLPPAQCKVAQCELALVSPPPPDEHTVAQKGGRCPATAPQAMVELSSWPVWSACPPAMLWLWRGLAEPLRYTFWEGRLEPPSLAEYVWNSSVESLIMARNGDRGLLWVEPMKAASEPSPLGERLRPPKQSVMNLRLPK